jgi:3-keto-5-aminohexanoate cleavage enzyme
VSTATPLIINVAPTGMVPTKEMTPHVPVSTEEILDDVARCRELGAGIVHVHARDESGVPTHRKEYFAPLVEGTRQIDPELVVCVTCSGRFVNELEARSEVLELTGDAKPDMASLTLGSNNFVGQASVNSPAMINGLAERMRERDIKPELEVFEPGMLDFARYLVGKGLIAEPCYVNVLLGNLGTSPLSPGSLGAFLSLLPDGWTWAGAGIGRYQLDANVMAIASGGHVRVGLEDNIWWDRERTTLATNAMLVERIVRVAELAERPIATPAEVRARLGLVRRDEAPRRPEAVEPGLNAA